MSDPDAYIALITSLPSSERLFRAKQPPLSRLRLERRLSVLTPEHRAQLARLERFVSWAHYAMEDNGREAGERMRAALAGVESETLHAIVRERMDVRAVLAALRLRRDGAGPPGPSWSPSRLASHMAAHWSDATFQLERRLPWIREAIALLEARDPLGLERLILGVTDQQLKRHGARHAFDFEAVVIYVLRWSIFDRWARSDARAAAHRFDVMAQEALARAPAGALPVEIYGEGAA